MKPTFTFSPDGVSIYAFTPGATTLRVIISVLLALLLCLALALVELAQIAMNIFTWLMVAPVPVIVRFVLIIAAFLAVITFSMMAHAHRMKEVSYE